MELLLKSLDDLEAAAQQIIRYAEKDVIWLFEGEMGVGKTTLIKAIAQELNVIDAVSSPTFSLVNEYNTTTDEVVYHFDLYRIEDEQEAFEIGIEDYFYSNKLCLVEWSEKIPSLIPDHYIKISIILGDQSHRTINLSRR